MIIHETKLLFNIIFHPDLSSNIHFPKPSTPATYTKESHSRVNKNDKDCLSRTRNASRSGIRYRRSVAAR